MSSRVVAISLAAVALLLTGCPPAVSVTIYNNAPNEITITWLRGQRVALLPHSSSRLSFPPVLTSFSTLIGGTQRVYRIHYPGKEFMYPSYHYGLQIEPTGKIYAVQSTIMPATHFPKQPSGYPLLPRT